MRALRFDYRRLDGIATTPQGGLRVPATLTRSGVFEYRKTDGSITRELRHPDEVFHKDAVESFANAPLSIGHVATITPDNWKEVAVGHVVGTPKQDGKFLAGDCHIMRRDAVSRVQSGELQELSCGYEVDIDPTPGTWNGERYDAVQRNIRGNHVALLPEGAGRAGPDVRLRTDGKDGAAQDVGFRVDSDVPIPPPVTTQADTDKGGAKGATVVDAGDKGGQAAATPDVLLGRIDSLTAENAELKKRLDAMPGQIETAAAERTTLLAKVSGFMPKEWKADGKDVATIEREALLALRPDLKLDGKSADYVRGAYEQALAGVETSRARAGSLQGPLHPAFVRDDGDADMDELEQKNKVSRKKSADAWKTPPKGALTRDSLRK
jgi:uncharacterized protein